MNAIVSSLKHIETEKIEFDINNPRRESETQIVTQKSFKNLVDSIKTDGIIVPIIVKDNGSNYTLIDGERRLRAAIEAKLLKVPALIAQKHIDGKILAYKTHKLHEKWNTVAETMSIKNIVNQLQKDDPTVSDNVLKKKIIEITHENNTKASDMLEIIKFDNDIIEKAMTSELSHSYLIHIGKSFIHKIKSKYPGILLKFNDKKLRSIMADKAMKGLLGKTRFLMDEFKYVFENTTHMPDIEILLLKFLRNRQKDIQQTYEEYNNLVDNTAPVQKESAKVTKDTIEIPKAKPKTKSAQTKNDNSDHKKIQLAAKEQTQLIDIRKKYETIAKGFSKDEEQYVIEAIHCLEEKCFKAAVLMIWATGISRILAFIENNIPDFNEKCKEMQVQSTSFYKFYSKPFKTDFKSIDEIRQNSKDMQLLCYICYKLFISEPNFKKMKGHFDKRNDCAHPTEIELNTNETVAIFEDILELILKNELIK